MSRLLQSFAYLPENTVIGPLFDGWLEAGADDALAPINAYEPSPADGMIARDGAVPKGGVLLPREPYIAINTESENRGANWMGDSDLPDYKFRTSQIPGTSHDAFYNMITYYEGYLHDDAKNNCCELKFSGCQGEPLDTPYEYIFHAALRNLFVWVREGVPAPHGPKIHTVPAGPGDFDALGLMQKGPKMKYENRKDVFGRRKK